LTKQHFATKCTRSLFFKLESLFNFQGAFPAPCVILRRLPLSRFATSPRDTLCHTAGFFVRFPAAFFQPGSQAPEYNTTSPTLLSIPFLTFF
jgi:hypothetical protein